MNITDSKGPNVVTISAGGALIEIEQLETMAAKLIETACRLPAGSVCRDFLKEIGKFGIRIAALKAKGLRSQNAHNRTL
jgi:hypothetical protein